MPQRTINALIHFSRVAADSRRTDEVLPLLARAAIEHVGADAAAVFSTTPDGEAKLAASEGLPEVPLGWTAEAIDDSLSTELRAACKGRFSNAYTLPLVSTGGLFGALVVLSTEGHALDAAHLQLAEGLADMAAIAMGVAAHLSEITRAHAELRASQDTLLRTEKLRALGQMAAGLSHDLKNVCNPMVLHVQLARRALAKKDEATLKEAIDEMDVIVRRAISMLERLRDFSRQSPESKPERLELNKLVHEASELAKPRMASRGGRMNRIVEQLGEPAAILGRAGEIVSAVVNLIVNAIDAMPNGGTITLRTGNSNGGAWVAVADDGPGMTPEVQQRVFEPFFSTKGEEGTGLGLAMVYACMQRHGGSVSLETAPGKGATFTLWFPGAP